MALETLSQEAVLKASSVVENAPYVVQGQGYTDLYSLRSKSSQSQNCIRKCSSVPATTYKE